MTGFFSTMTECDLANHPVSPSHHANQYLLDNLECKQHAYGGNQQHLALHACQVHDDLDILVLLKGQVGGGGGHPAAVIDYWGRDGGVNNWSIGLDGGYGHPEGQ